MNGRRPELTVLACRYCGGVPAEIVEPVYRALIAASIEDQRRIFRRLAR